MTRIEYPIKKIVNKNSVLHNNKSSNHFHFWSGNFHSIWKYLRCTNRPLVSRKTVLFQDLIFPDVEQTTVRYQSRDQSLDYVAKGRYSIPLGSSLPEARKRGSSFPCCLLTLCLTLSIKRQSNRSP